MYSDALKRNINVPIEYLNHVYEVEIDEAIAALPGYPNTTPTEIIEAAERGDINARFVIEAAKNGDPIAQDWVLEL